MNDKLEDKVSELIEKIGNLAAKLEMYIEGDKERRKENSLKLQDHEKRIRFLERYAFMLLGITSLFILILKVMKVV